MPDKSDINDNSCAPTKYDSVNNTCFSTNQLLEMANAYNRYITKNNLSIHPNKKFPSNTSLIKIKNNKSYLLTELLKRFKKICDNDQVCITKQTFMNEIVKEMRDDITDNTFRHVGPTDATQWLSTIDINNIMNQYEKVYDNFKFLGAIPLNCEIFEFCALYKLDFDKYKKMGFTQLGVIFNHDKHGQPGSHWVALYMDIVNGLAYFCDSSGNKPIDNINNLISKFSDYYKKNTDNDIDYKYNTKTYQKDDSECGVYSCNFLIRCLSGESFNNIIKNSFNFKQINGCRNVYFRNKPSPHTINEKCDITKK